MFGSKNKKEQPKVKSKESKGQPSKAKSYGNVYVMPNKFQGQQSQVSVKPLILAVAVLIVVAIVVASYFIYESTRPKDILDYTEPEPSPVVDNSRDKTPDNIDNTNGSSDGGLIDNTAENNADLTVNNSADINNGDNTNTDNIVDNTVDNTTNKDKPVDKSADEPVSLEPAVYSSDVDRDGLTDIEEGIFGTSPSRPDSDADGFTDGSEVKGGYNPAVATGGMLKDATYIDTIETNFVDDNFKVLYIKNWFAKSLPAIKQVQITTDTGENIKITVSDNIKAISMSNWYLVKNPLVLPSQIETYNVGDLEGIISPSGLQIYLTDPLRKKIYTFEYMMDGEKEMRYPAIFRMIVDSFKLISPEDLIAGDGNNTDVPPTSTEPKIE